MSSNTERVKLTNVSKFFYKQEQRTFKEMLPALFMGQRISQAFLAVQNVSLSLHEGEVLGLIGANGSGKSTLLKLIAGVSKPSSGKIQVNGKVAPLIELGAGFHYELSGRENIFLNGVILGLSRNEVELVFDEIVSFAELDDFIDQPVKHYSSGMFLRLAFAVAVHTNPRILLVDEILAVGDMAFQEKCFQRMHKFQQEGVATLFVSHNEEQVKAFCDQAMLLDHGEIIDSGAPRDVLKHYKQLQKQHTQ